MEKTIFQLKDILQKPDQYSSKLSRLSKHGKTEKKFTKDTWRLNVMWYIGHVPDAEKGHQIKSKEIWIQYGLYLTVMYQYSFFNCDKCVMVVR